MFKELPRYCGFPNQVFVERKFAFDSFFNNFNGKVPFFVSTYQFVNRTTPIVDSLIFDIDSYFGMRSPYLQTKKLKRFCDEYSFPYITDLSGGKGFHQFMIIKDIIPETEIEKEKLKNKIYSIQVAICKQLGITDVDYATFGRLHFLVRYPTSKYVRKEEDTGKNEWNKRYCRYIPPKDFESGLRQIGRLSRTPGIVPKKPKSNVTLDDIISVLPDYKLMDRTNGEDRIELIRAGIEPPSVCAIGLPCMKEFVEHSHPTHYERVELGSWLKFLGYTDLAIEAFIKRRGWTRHKDAVTKYQVTTLLPRYPNCRLLGKYYGDKCKNCSLYWRRNK